MQTEWIVAPSLIFQRFVPSGNSGLTSCDPMSKLYDFLRPFEPFVESIFNGFEFATVNAQHLVRDGVFQTQAT
jgi:hypothetical protein